MTTHILKTTDLVDVDRDPDRTPIAPGLGFPDDRGISPSGLEVIYPKGNIVDWSNGRVARGVASSDALIDDTRQLPDDDSWATKKRLRAIVRKAMELGGGNVGSGNGSAIHGAIDFVHSGGRIEEIANPLARRGAQAFVHVTGVLGATVLGTEIQVASPELGTLGKTDGVLATRKTPAAVFDTKSNKPGSEGYASTRASWLLQAYSYAHSKPYCAMRGLLEWSDLGMPEPSRQKALVIHLPAVDMSQAKVHVLDLTGAEPLVRLALAVHAARRDPVNVLTTYDVGAP